MKKTIALACLLVSMVLVMPVSLVIADQEPNENACLGQLISEGAHLEPGAVADAFNHDGEAQTYDWNGDGKTNGQDLAFILELVRAELC